METISKSAYNLLLWLQAMMELYKIHSVVNPMRDKVDEMEKKTKKMAIELQ